MVVFFIGLFVIVGGSATVWIQWMRPYRIDDPFAAIVGRSGNVEGVSCQSGKWVFTSEYSVDDESLGTWIPSQHCRYHEFRGEEVEQVFRKYKRVLFVGDSIQRGLFWNLVGLLKGVNDDSLRGNRLKYEMTNHMHQHAFTNVQDQEFFARNKKDGSLIYSIRFVYAAHAADFDGRCEAVNHWFFQCPEPLDSVMSRVLKEARESRHPYGLVYMNVGMWDWRTGVPVSLFAKNMIRTLEGLSEALASQGRLIWRHITPAYPSKFAWPEECKKSKIREDNRPCNIHTDGLIRYNLAVTKVLKRFRFEIIDPWLATATRPDLTIDGIHYTLGGSTSASSAPHKYDWASSDLMYTPMYRVLNNHFFSVVSSPVAAYRE